MATTTTTMVEFFVLFGREKERDVEKRANNTEETEKYMRLMMLFFQAVVLRVHYYVRLDVDVPLWTVVLVLF